MDNKQQGKEHNTTYRAMEEFLNKNVVKDRIDLNVFEEKYPIDLKIYICN